MMEFVSWDEITFPTEWKNKIHVPNHQPDIYGILQLFSRENIHQSCEIFHKDYRRLNQETGGNGTLKLDTLWYTYKKLWKITVFNRYINYKLPLSIANS